jgi:hypothetical protein
LARYTNAKTPVDQFLLVGSFLGGSGYILKNLQRNYHLMRAAEAKDSYAKGLHRYRGNLTDAQIADAFHYSRTLKAKAVILGFAPLMAILVYIKAKQANPKISRLSAPK